MEVGNFYSFKVGQSNIVYGPYKFLGYENCLYGTSYKSSNKTNDRIKTPHDWLANFERIGQGLIFKAFGEIVKLIGEDSNHKKRVVTVRTNLISMV